MQNTLSPTRRDCPAIGRSRTLETVGHLLCARGFSDRPLSAGQVAKIEARALRKLRYRLGNES